MQSKLPLIALAATLPIAAGTATAAPESAGREQLVLAINAAFIEALADGTIDAINAAPVFPGAPPPSTYTTNISDCLPNPEVNPYPGNPKGRFKEILQTGSIVRATIQGLGSLTTVDQVARERGVEPASIPYRSRARGKETAHA